MAAKKASTHTVPVYDEPTTIKDMVERFAGPTRQQLKESVGGTLEAYVGERMNPPAKREQFTKWYKAKNIETKSLFRILDAFASKYELKFLVSFDGDPTFHEIVQFEAPPPKRGRPKGPLLLAAKSKSTKADDDDDEIERSQQEQAELEEQIEAKLHGSPARWFTMADLKKLSKDQHAIEIGLYYIVNAGRAVVSSTNPKKWKSAKKAKKKG